MALRKGASRMVSDLQNKSTDIVLRLRETGDDWPAYLIKLEMEAADEIERLRRALAFARSCIKSGEAWSETCERELRL